MRSIRSYLLTRILGGTSLVLIGAGGAVYVAVTRTLEQQFDRNLSDRVQGFASILFQTATELSFEFSDELMPEYDRAVDPEYFELWLADGEVLERSNTLGERDLELDATPTFEPHHWTAPLPDERLGRFVSRKIEVHHVFPEEGPDRPQAEIITVVVARGREPLIAAERALLLRVSVTALLLIGLVCSVAWRAVRGGLEPTRRLVEALDELRPNELPDRIDLGSMPQELEPVTRTIDALIQRVDSALKRERRTTADIAHELRTPLSELLTVSEVALRNGTDVEETVQALGAVRDVAWKMGRSVSTLLKLARLEMGAEKFERESVDLGQLVAQLFSTFSPLQRERELVVENRLPAGLTVTGDRDVLTIVVSNLLSNALYHSPVRALVSCALERTKSEWTFVVENESGELEEADLVALTQPFWRKDEARADRARSGLGLALSRSLAESADLRLEFALADGRFRALLHGRTAPR